VVGLGGELAGQLALAAAQLQPGLFEDGHALRTVVGWSSSSGGRRAGIGIGISAGLAIVGRGHLVGLLERGQLQSRPGREAEGDGHGAGLHERDSHLPRWAGVQLAPPGPPGRSALVTTADRSIMHFDGFSSSGPNSALTFTASWNLTRASTTRAAPASDLPGP